MLFLRTVRTERRELGTRNGTEQISDPHSLAYAI